MAGQRQPNTFVQLPKNSAASNVLALFASRAQHPTTVPVKCLNPRCGTEFAEDANGRYAIELVHTGVDRAFVCPVCQHWNRLGGIAANVDRPAIPPAGAPATTRIAQPSDA
jgi:hypothetical protein